eukprot:4348966-Lingulodinium_polyedra.AAC.1
MRMAFRNGDRCGSARSHGPALDSPPAVDSRPSNMGAPPRYPPLALGLPGSQPLARTRRNRLWM